MQERVDYRTSGSFHDNLPAGSSNNFKQKRKLRTSFMKWAWRARMRVAGELDLSRRLFDVNQIKGPFAGMRAGAATAMIAIICAAVGLLPVSRAWSAPGGQRLHHSLQVAAEKTAPVAEPEADDDDKDVPTSQVDKYISVYEAMQKDHNLTVEQAASKQGLTVTQFRQLENKIESDDTLRERVRKALRHAANPKAKDSSDD
jgi:hypothetical protein